MRAGDLDRARAESRIGVFVGDDRDQAAVFFRADRDFAKLADDGGIAFVGGMHRDSTVAQHGFGPGCGDRDVVAGLAQGDIAVFVFLNIFVGLAASERVFEVPHVARGLDILDLQIGNRGLEMRIPVHQPLAAIDEALVVHVDEDLDDGIVEIAVLALGGTGRAGHGEGVARPVATGTKPLELFDDRAAGFNLLFPDLGGEFFAP